jgi:hypothetical protein
MATNSKQKTVTPNVPPPPGYDETGKAIADIAPPPGYAFSGSPQHELESMSGGADAGISKPPPWYSTPVNAVKDIGKGVFNQFGTMATQLPRTGAEILEAVIGQKLDPKWTEPASGFENDPERPWQGRAAGATELASYLYGGGLEAKGANLVNAAVRKSAPAFYRTLRSPFGKNIAQGVVKGGAALTDMIASSGIGGVGDALMANLNREDPNEAFKVGATIPGATVGLKRTGILPRAAEMFRGFARNAVARALEPGSWYDKWAAKNILDPLLQKGKVWASQKGLFDIADKLVDESKMRQQGFIPAPDAVMDYDEALRILRDDRDVAFKTARSGAQMTAPGTVQLGTMAEYGGPEAKEADEFIDKFLREYLDRASFSDPTTGSRYIPFSELDKAKGYMDKEVALAHGYGGMRPEVALPDRTRGYRVAANSIRPQLEDFAGDEWANENQIQHTWLQILSLARKGMGKEIGKKIPLAEKPLTGFGAHLGRGEGPLDKSVLIRAMRMLADTPLWNSATAQAKWRFADFLASTSGYKPSQVINWFAGIQDNPSATPSDIDPDLLQPGMSVEMPEVGGEYEWTAPGQLQRR